MKARLHLVSGIFAALLFSFVQAEPVAYSDVASFASALPVEPMVLDFDRLPTGTMIEDSSTADGITFSYDFEGLPMTINHLYATTSAPNFLGTVDGGMFHDGDDFNLDFRPGSAIGLFFISADPLLDGDITLSAGGATASLIAEDVQYTLPDGSKVFFIGIVDAQTHFSTARVEALAGGFFLYNVDDIITAPAEAATLTSVIN